MKIGAFTTLAFWLAGIAGAQVTQGPGANKRPKADFGWQNRQQEVLETRERLLDRLVGMSEEEWTQLALAHMAFDSREGGVSFADAVRIGAVRADRRALTREVEDSSEGSPVWMVTFGRKTPKVVTLTLTDRDSTEVRCEVRKLVEAGAGYVGVFQTSLELLCLARPTLEIR